MLSIRQRFQLCSRTRGTSVGLHTSKQHLRRCHGYLVCERILRPLQLRGSSGAMHLLAASIQLELLGCLQYLLRDDNKLRKHCHDLQKPPRDRSVWVEKRENVQHLHSFGSSCFQCTPGWMLVSQPVHFLVLPSWVVFAMRPFCENVGK